MYLHIHLIQFLVDTIQAVLIELQQSNFACKIWVKFNDVLLTLESLIDTYLVHLAAANMIFIKLSRSPVNCSKEQRRTNLEVLKSLFPCPFH